MIWLTSPAIFTLRSKTLDHLVCANCIWHLVFKYDFTPAFKYVQKQLYKNLPGLAVSKVLCLCRLARGKPHLASIILNTCAISHGCMLIKTTLDITQNKGWRTLYFNGLWNYPHRWSSCAWSYKKSLYLTWKISFIQIHITYTAQKNVSSKFCLTHRILICDCRFINAFLMIKPNHLYDRFKNRNKLHTLW